MELSIIKSTLFIKNHDNSAEFAAKQQHQHCLLVGACYVASESHLFIQLCYDAGFELNPKSSSHRSISFNLINIIEREYINIYIESSVTWFGRVLVGINMSGESFTGIPVLRSTGVYISSKSSGSNDFGESSLEYICPVSPLQNIIVLLRMYFQWVLWVNWFRWVLVGIYMFGESSTEYHSTTTVRMYFQWVLWVKWFLWVLRGIYMSGESSTEYHSTSY